MFDTPTAIALAVTLMALSLTCLGLAVSLIHVRRRQRTLRATLARVRDERDVALRGMVTRG